MKQNYKEFSAYGMYNISDKLELRLPKTEINIVRSDSRLSYYRKNSEDQEVRKSITQSSKTIRIEVCPILPLHLPAKKTNDLMFLRLAETIFLEKKSTSTILVQFPIEIGVFIINQNDGSKELFDYFTCEPMHSRFALYGTPEKGILCMYSKVNILEKRDDSNPYIFARMRVTITNDLDKGVFIGKFIFLINSHNIYYVENSSEVHIDDITCIVKQDINKEIIEIKREEYSKKGNDWKLVSYSNDKDNIQFIMDKGFD